MAGFGIVIARESTGPVVPIETVLVSDGFSGSGELVGRSADNAAGGSATLAWQGTAGRFVVNSGTLGAAGAASAVTGLAMPSADYYVSAVIAALPTGADVGVVGRRTVLSGGSHVGITVAPSGDLAGVGIRPSGTVVPGDRIGLRFKGGEVEALVNDVVIATGTTVLTEPGFAGISRISATVLSIDNFQVKRPA